jgi:hypothetical protein
MRKIVSQCDGRTRLAAIVVAAALGLATSAASVAAATLDLVDGTLRYDATRNTVNDLSVAPTGSAYTIHDDGEAVLSPSPQAVTAGCRTVDACGGGPCADQRDGE